MKFRVDNRELVRTISNNWLSKPKYDFAVSLPDLSGKAFEDAVKSNLIPRHTWKKFDCSIMKGSFGKTN